MFSFQWLRNLFVRSLNEEFNAMDAEAQKWVEARAATLLGRMQSRMANALRNQHDEPVDVEWTPTPILLEHRNGVTSVPITATQKKAPPKAKTAKPVAKRKPGRPRKAA